MPDDTSRHGPFIARRSLIAASVLAIGASAARPIFAQTAGGEGGEGGEGAAPEAGPGEGEAGEAGFLFALGQYEAQALIVAALATAGKGAVAQEHLAATGHADYEAFEAGFARHGIAAFADRADTFGNAVTKGGDAAAMTAAAESLADAIAVARAGAAPTDLAKAVELLVRDAGADFEAGVAAGKVTDPQEYRDAWGYVQAAVRIASDLSAAPDPKAAAFGAAALRALEPLAAALPGADADAVSGGADIFYGAAARIELAAYSLTRP
ncbi:MAG: hypothetical protein ACKVPY_09855 [Paracoccaceae bacterium]